MYYYFFTKEDETINIIREATKEEFEYLKERTSQIGKMMSDKKRIDNFIRCYEKIINQYSKYAQGFDIREVTEELNADIAAYLGSFKKFTDNWQTAITREFGKNSKELQMFKKSLAEQYDTYMEYRIMYRLRNYDQHCGDIVSSITASSEGDENTYKVYMNRDYLLENFDEWKEEERVYLSKCDELIEIFPIMMTFHNCVLNAYAKMMDIRINENLSKCCVEILKFIKDISDEDVIYIWIGKKALTEHLGLDGSFSVDFLHIDRKICRSILKMYIRLKQNIVKILYHGEKIGEKISDCAICVNKDNFKNINPQSPFFSINGERYINLFSSIQLNTKSYYGVYADVTLKQSEREKLCEEYKEYLQVLLEEKCSR